MYLVKFHGMFLDSVTVFWMDGGEGKEVCVHVFYALDTAQCYIAVVFYTHTHTHIGFRAEFFNTYNFSFIFGKRDEVWWWKGVSSVSHRSLYMYILGQPTHTHTPT
jgi:hypothetical protein